MLISRKSTTLIAVLTAAICMAMGVLYGILKHVNAQPVTEPTRGLGPVPIPTPPVSTDPASPKPKVFISPSPHHVSGPVKGQLSKSR